MRTPEQPKSKNSLKLRLGLFVMPILALGCGIVEAVTPTRNPHALYLNNLPPFPTAEIMLGICQEEEVDDRLLGSTDADPCQVVTDENNKQVILLHPWYATDGMDLSYPTDNKPTSPDGRVDESHVFALSIAPIPQGGECKQVFLSDEGPTAKIIESTGGIEFRQDNPDTDVGILDTSDPKVDLCVVMYLVPNQMTNQ